MRLVLGLLAVTVWSCTAKSSEPKDRAAPPPAIDAAPAADVDPSLIAIATPVPPGPYVIAYDCSHSNMPFGKGGWYRNQSVDLGALTWTSLEVTMTGDEPDLKPGDPAPPPPKPTVTAVSPGVADMLSAAIARVLAGGPYRAEYPVPEGTPCRLTIAAAGRPVLVIDKAYTKQRDAVSDLVEVFTAGAGK